MLSAHVDVDHATELSASGRDIGYLLKNRMAEVIEFLDTLHRVAMGGSAVEPALVHELSVRRRDDPLSALGPREREA